MNTDAMPMAPASRLCCRKFRPRVGLILLKLTSSMEFGSAPYRSTVTSWLTSAAREAARDLAVAAEARALMDGADWTMPSSTIANCSWQ